MFLKGEFFLSLSDKIGFFTGQSIAKTGSSQIMPLSSLGE
jgi:hypothetical protein